MNPLLDFSGLPRFTEFKPEHVTPAVDQLLRENRALIERVVADDVPATWRDFVEPLEDANERLGRAWGQVGHLNAVMNSPQLRETYNANLPKITQYYTRAVAASGPVREVQGSFKAAPDSRRLTGAAQDRRERTARFPPRRRRPAGRKEDALQGRPGTAVGSGIAIQRQPARRDQCVCSLRQPRAQELAGIPEDVLAAAREAAQAEGKAGLEIHAARAVLSAGAAVRR